MDTPWSQVRGGSAAGPGPQMKDPCSGGVSCGFLLWRTTPTSFKTFSREHLTLSYSGTKDLLFLCVQSFSYLSVDLTGTTTSFFSGGIFWCKVFVLVPPAVAVHCLRAASAYTLSDIDQVLLTTPCFSEV